MSLTCTQQRAAAPVASRSIGRSRVHMAVPAARQAAVPSVAAQQQQRQQRARGVACRAAGAQVHEGGLVAADGMRFGVVVGRFNDLVTKLLLDGCLHSFKHRGVPDSNVDVAWVPGSFELPVVAKAMAKSGKYDAVVCIGVVVRGATTHYDAVVGAATSGCLGASTDTGVPVVFGVLTCDTMEQALDRAGGKVGNKGGEAAATAVEMANLMAQLRDADKAAKAWI